MMQCQALNDQKPKKMALTTPKDHTTVISKGSCLKLTLINRISKNLDPDAQIFLYIADFSANNLVYPKNFSPIGETVSEQLALQLYLKIADNWFKSLLILLAARAYLDRLGAIYFGFYME